jgi:signal transduction histidine kinase
VPEEAPSTGISGRELVLGDAARTFPLWQILRSREFWRTRPLHPLARLLLIIVASVLMCIAIGFIVADGRFTRSDLLAIVFNLGLIVFAWRPVTAAFIVMAICGTGVIFTGNGGDLLELATSLGLVATTCVAWVTAVHMSLLVALTAHIALSSSTLGGGGVYGIAGVAVIALLAGVAFRLVTAREVMLVAERARIMKDLEAISREEQERIADDLHDGIAHDITLILFHARALPRQPDETSRQVSLNTIEDSAKQALESIQSLLSLMRNTETQAPEAHVARYDGRVIEAVLSLGTLLNNAGIPTRVSVPKDPIQITPFAERLLTEIAIEAVTNIIKHAPSSQSASIEIETTPEAVELVVTNVAPAGSADEQGTSGGRGLSRARQRIAQSNGQLDSGRTQDGWLLRAAVPTALDQAS